jgi:tRNA(adenine34) deaminase
VYCEGFAATTVCQDGHMQRWNFVMEQAIGLAQEAIDHGDIPIGALVLDASGRVIGQGANTRERDHDPMGHAEVNALRDAANTLGSWRLDDCTLVVTLEPCAMCAGAIVQSRIKTLVFGAFDEKAGAVGSLWDLVRDRRLPHRAEVISGVLAQQCADLLTNFFAQNRNN